jgi:hypothetical protein
MRGSACTLQRDRSAHTSADCRAHGVADECADGKADARAGAASDARTDVCADGKADPDRALCAGRRSWPIGQDDEVRSRRPPVRWMALTQYQHAANATRAPTQSGAAPRLSGQTQCGLDSPQLRRAPPAPPAPRHGSAPHGTAPSHAMRCPIGIGASLRCSTTFRFVSFRFVTFRFVALRCGRAGIDRIGRYGATTGVLVLCYNRPEYLQRVRSMRLHGTSALCTRSTRLRATLRGT